MSARRTRTKKDGPWCLYWLSTDDERGPEWRYATREDAEAALEAKGEDAGGYEVRQLAEWGAWVGPDEPVWYADAEHAGDDGKVEYAGPCQFCVWWESVNPEDCKVHARYTTYAGAYEAQQEAERTRINLARRHPGQVSGRFEIREFVEGEWVAVQP